jgi:hypothetical protein
MRMTAKNILLAIVALIVAYVVLGWVLKFVLGLALGLVAALLPIAVLVGAVYVAYLLFGRKALGGGRRTLP